MLQLYTWLVKYLYIMRWLDKPYLGNVCLTQPARLLIKTYSLLTTLSTLIYEITWKIHSLATLTKLFYQKTQKNSLIINYVDCAAWHEKPLTTLTELLWKTATDNTLMFYSEQIHHWLCWHPSSAYIFPNIQCSLSFVSVFLFRFFAF